MTSDVEGTVYTSPFSSATNGVGFFRLTAGFGTGVCSPPLTIEKKLRNSMNPGHGAFFCPREGIDKTENTDIMKIIRNAMMKRSMQNVHR